MKRRTLLSLAAVLTVASAASLAAFTDVFAAQRLIKPVAPIHHEETIGNLAYEVRLSNNQYRLNDEIVISAQVTNIGDEPIPYSSGSSSCPSSIGVAIVHPETDTRLAAKPTNQVCTLDLVGSELQPGHAVKDTFTFITEQWRDSELVPAHIGDYQVRVSLPIMPVIDRSSLPEAEPAPSTATITLRSE